MKKKTKRGLFAALLCLAAFALWTLLLRTVDVRPIGPGGSLVGLAGLNGLVHRSLGVCMPLYTVTDWLGLVPIAVALGFALLGLVQWIRRRRFLQVDRSILVLGGFYLVVAAVYMLFEYVVINRRPVLINGYLEASYPSSTTLLVMCVMPTALMQWRARTKNGAMRHTVTWVSIAFMAFMVIGRLCSGVHWVTDIIGGGLLSAGLVTLYAHTVQALRIQSGEGA